MKKKQKRTFAVFLAMVGIIAIALIGCGGNDNPTTTQNPTPTAADFDIGNLSQTVGSVTAVTVKAKQGKSTGAITIYYTGATTLPTGNGGYAITFDVAAASGWNEAKGLSAGTLRINDAINSLDELAAYLSGKAANTATTPYYIALKITNANDFVALLTKLNSATDKYVYLDLSGSTVTSIPVYAFYSSPACATLVGITIPDTITTIESGAFRGCTSLTSATIGSGVTTIGSNAFRGCTSLASVTIPDSVISIGIAAFYGCTSLASATIGSGVTSTGDINPFPECTSLAVITVVAGNIAYTTENGVLYTKEKTTLVAYPAGKTGASFTIPNTVTSIGSAAFYVCTSLTSVTIPNSVTSIGSSAFYNCTSLTSVTIPNSVTNIGSGAFYGTAWLNNQQNDVVYINKIAYGYNGAMPENTSITLANDTIGIADSAFSNQTNLTGITMPNSVTSIGTQAFYGCTGLASVTIPNSVTSIGEVAFYQCISLTAINVDAGNSAYSSQDGVWYNKEKTTLIQYPAKKADTTFTIPNSVTSIGDSALFSCTNLASVTIPNSVTSIGRSAFFGCTGLTSIIIGNRVTSIEYFAFYQCTSLASVKFEGTIASAGFDSGAFYNLGDLRAKFYATDTSNGTPGTYTTTAPVGSTSVWTKE